jgi:hypothetical protein
VERIEMQSENFSRQKQVTEIRSGMALTGIAIAGRIQRTIIRAVLGIFDHDTAF